MRIYGDSRLIEDDKPWFVSNSAGNIEPSEKTAGKLLRSCFAVVFQSDKPDGFFDKFLSPIFVMYVQTAEIIDIFRYSQLIKNRYILQYDTNLLLDFVVVRRHFLSEDLDVALIIFQQRKETVDRSCFAGTVRTKKTEDLSFFDIQTEMVQSNQIAIAFYKIFYMNHNSSSGFI